MTPARFITSTELHGLMMALDCPLKQDGMASSARTAPDDSGRRDAALGEMRRHPDLRRMAAIAATLRKKCNA